MTQDEIIRMAREAGFPTYSMNSYEKERLADFAALVAAHEREKYEQGLDVAIDTAMLLEREACAKVCKDIANSQFESGETETAGVLDHCAAAIRARGEK